MQGIEKWSKLLAVIENMEEPLTISEIAEKADMHFETAENMLEFLQASQEFSYLIKIIKKRRSFLVFKIPNNDSNRMLTSKIDNLHKKIDLLLKKYGTKQM